MVCMKNQVFETNINTKADNRKQAFLYLDQKFPLCQLYWISQIIRANELSLSDCNHCNLDTFKILQSNGCIWFEQHLFISGHSVIVFDVWWHQLERIILVVTYNNIEYIKYNFYYVGMTFLFLKPEAFVRASQMGVSHTHDAWHFCNTWAWRRKWHSTF